MLVIYKITNQTPKNWDDYIKLLISVYKILYLTKTQDTIFSLNENIKRSEKKERT